MKGIGVGTRLDVNFRQLSDIQSGIRPCRNHLAPAIVVYPLASALSHPPMKTRLRKSG